MVLHAEFDGFALARGEDGDVLAFDEDVRAAEVLQGGDEGDAAGVDEVAVGREDVDVGADGEAFRARDYAQRFRV